MSYYAGFFSGWLVFRLDPGNFFPEIFRTPGTSYIQSGETYDFVQKQAEKMGIAKNVLIATVPPFQGTMRARGTNVTILPRFIGGESRAVIELECNNDLLENCKTEKQKNFSKCVITHELAHIKHNDFFRELIWTIVGIVSSIFLNLFVGFFSFLILARLSARNSEKNADIEALKYLNNDEKEAFKEQLKSSIFSDQFISGSRIRNLLDPHPSNEARIRYIEESQIITS